MKRFFAVVVVLFSVSYFSFGSNFYLSFDTGLSNNRNMTLNKNSLNFYMLGMSCNYNHLYLNAEGLIPNKSIKNDTNSDNNKYGGASGSLGYNVDIPLTTITSLYFRTGLNYQWIFEEFDKYTQHLHSFGLFIYPGLNFYIAEKTFCSLGVNMIAYPYNLYFYKRGIKGYESTGLEKIGFEPKLSIGYRL